MRDCTYTSHNGRDWQLASNSLKSASTATPPRSQVASRPGQAGLEVWITCEFLGRVPTGGSPPIAAKAGVPPGVTDLADRGTDGPDLQAPLWNLGLPTFGPARATALPLPWSAESHENDFVSRWPRLFRLYLPTTILWDNCTLSG